MKQAALAVILAALFTGCGATSSSSSSQVSPSTTLKQRAFISNQLASAGLPAGQVMVVDAARDLLANVISVGGQPSFMVLSSDKTKTFLFDSQSNDLIVLDNTTETSTGAVALNDIARSLVVLGDNNTALVALRNNGSVAFVDTANSAITATIGLPAVRTLVLSHGSSRALAFSDNARNSLAVIDTSARTAVAITSAAFDYPIYGVFSSDDSKAYILSCGAECGGATAKVSVLDMASGAVSQTVPVSAATIALLDGSRLYVAGTQGTSGKLDVVDVGTMTVSKSGVAISDGFHQVISLGTDNRLFIGARTCNNVTSGCLSIFNTTTQTATVDTPHGDVTGLQPITGRSIVYVIEGGELRIINTSTEVEQTFPAIDIVGRAIDVKLVE